MTFLFPAEKRAKECNDCVGQVSLRVRKSRTEVGAERSVEAGGGGPSGGQRSAHGAIVTTARMAWRSGSEGLWPERSGIV